MEKLTEYEIENLLTIGAVIHQEFGSENWYFLVVNTGERGFIKML